MNKKDMNKETPVNIGEEYDVVIENVGDKGDGITKIKGYVCIVKSYPNQGASCKIKIIKTLPKYCFAEVVVN